METKDLGELRPNKKNPRKISKQDFDALKRALVEFGDLSGIILNTASGQLVGGHMRLEAFQRLGGRKQVVITQRFEQPNKQGTTAVGYVTHDNEFFSYREVLWPLDATDAQGNAYSSREYAANISANRISGEWDLDMLAELNYELSQLDNGNELLELTGQRLDELKQLANASGLDDTADQEPKDPSMVLRVECENDQQMNELYRELKQRGLNVKL